MQDTTVVRIMKMVRWIGLSLLVAIAMMGCGRQASENESRSDQATDTAITATDQSDAKPDQKKTILFFGNSITEGVGVAPEQAFPARISERIDSLGFAYQVVNAGLGGETTSGGLNRLEWVISQYPVDVFVLELGGNDGLRGINPTESKKNLQSIIDVVKREYPNVTILLAGMESPPNLGEEFNRAFRRIFPELAYANGLPLIPFILEGVAGDPALNLSDGIHPTPYGHRLVADHVWSYLRPLLSAPDA